MRRSALLGAALLLFLAATGAAAPSRLGLVSFQRIPIPEDVPAHLASALAQDRAGFLWIGTQDGLVRYDGYSFRVYKSDPNDPRSLGGSYVRTLLAASDGRVWAGTFSSGVSAYDPARINPAPSPGKPSSTSPPSASTPPSAAGVTPGSASKPATPWTPSEPCSASGKIPPRQRRMARCGCGRLA